MVFNLALTKDMEDTIESLITSLRYYQSEHGDFAGYISETVRKLKELGYKGPWVFNNDERKLGNYTESLASQDD